MLFAFANKLPITAFEYKVGAIDLCDLAVQAFVVGGVFLTWVDSVLGACPFFVGLAGEKHLMISCVKVKHVLTGAGRRTDIFPGMMNDSERY